MALVATVSPVIHGEDRLSANWRCKALDQGFAPMCFSGVTGEVTH